MSQHPFSSGVYPVGAKQVPFSLCAVQGGYAMYAPSAFCRDKALVPNYTYLYSPNKSPLSIAIKFSPAASAAERDKLVTRYFNQQAKALACDESGNRVLYRETTTAGRMMGIYSLRFAADVPEGLLFGCFNCSAAYADDWRPAVLEMLGHIQPA